VTGFGQKETGNSKNPQFYRLIRIFLETLVFIALVAVTAILLRPLHNAMESRMRELRDGLISRAETVLNRDIKYDSIGPSIFGVLDIRNIRISRQDSSPVITIARLRISYSFLNLLKGNISESFRSVRIDNPLINLDFERDADLLNLFSPRQENNDADLLGKIALFLPENFLVRIKNGEAESVQGETRVRISTLAFDASIRRGRAFFQARLDAYISGEGFLKAPFAVSMTGRVNGECSADLHDGAMNLSVLSLTGDFFKLKPLTFNLNLADNKIELRKINDRSPYDISADYDLRSGRLSGVLRTDKFSPRDILSLSGSWKDYNPWLGLQISGFASVHKEPQGNWGYTIELAGDSPPRLPVKDASFDIRGKGDQRSVKLEMLSLRSPQGNLRFQGEMGFQPFSPNGYISVSELGVLKGPRVNADFTVNARNGEIELFGENVSIGEVLLSALDMSLTQKDDGLSFALSLLRFKDLESYEDVRLGNFSLEGSFDYSPRRIEARIALDSFALNDIIDMLRPFVVLPDPPGIAGEAVEEISVTTEVFITTDFEHILYNAPRFVAAYEGKQNIFVFASLSGTDRRFELNDGSLIWPGGSVEVSFSTDLSNFRDIPFFLAVSYLDASYYLEGMILERRFVSIHGSYGFQLYIGTSDFGAYSGYVKADNIPVPYKGQSAQLSLLVSLRYDSPDFWSVEVDNFKIADIITPASSLATLSVSGAVDQDGASFPNLSFDDHRNALKGKASLSWDRSYSNFDGSLSASDESGTERYDLKGTFLNKSLDLRLTGTNMQIGRAVRNSHGAAVSGSIRFLWDSRDFFSADLNIESLSARFADTELIVSASAVLNNEDFNLENLRASYAGLEAEMSFLRLNRPNTRAETQARIRGNAGGRELDLSFRAEAEFNPIDSWFDISQAFKSFRGSLTAQNIRFDTLVPEEPFNFIFSRTDSLITLSGGPKNMLRFRLSGGGDFYAGFSYPAPIRGALTGTLTAQTIDAQANNLYIDLGSLWRFIPSQEDLAISGGVVTATVRISGPLGDPDFFGSARGSSIRLRVPKYITADIRPDPFTLVLEGNKMSFGPIMASAGAGSGVVSGWFLFDRWIPNVFNIDIRVPQDFPIPFGFDIEGIIAQGEGSGVMKLALADMVLTVSGAISVQNTEISLNSNAFLTQMGMFSTQDPIAVILDLDIHTGRKVEFLWPSTGLPILQAQADLGTGLKISSDTMARRFSLIGDVKLRGGEIFYFERSFYIREGILSFNENEIQFDPRLSILAEIRDRTNDGPVTISMIIDNAPLRSFSARFESNPPLSQMDILSLLGQNLTGVPSEDGGDPLRRAFVNSTTDILAQFGIIRRLERQIRDALWLDMFSIRTQVLQNAVFQAAGLQDPVDRISGVSNYFDNTTVFLGKYFGSDMFIQSMFSIRYDENKTTFGGLTLEPELGIEMRSPLFDIRLNMVPLHPENWFIDDLSFTLSWKRSF
jgi:hypothetical protein